MIKIVSDTSTLYSIQEGKKNGVDIAPLSVTVANKSYKEYEEISPEEFLEKVKEGNLPTSSQPSIGEKLAIYNKYPKDQIIDITMADGLSGTYQSACSAKEMSDHSNNITVINSRTLCGPHRHLVEKAVALAKKKYSVTDIVKELSISMNHCKSFLIPEDFDFLRRGGRLSTLSASIGSFLKIVPIMTQTPDGTVLEKFGMKRTFSGAIAEIISFFKGMNINDDYIIYVTHAGNEEKAIKAKEMIIQSFPTIQTEIMVLSPAFITQGGPGCVAIQTILK